MHIIDKIFKKIVKKASIENIRCSKLKNLYNIINYFWGWFSIRTISKHSEQIANSSIDLKK